ncbi:hypothetical protein OHA77_13345 [Streptosporangium sp. NBC_01639]|uniref:hypothetical protein n=1 Tax=Streptosporangium sp. NBC_01639 TaxID=2975948 RepID=UPI003863767F|nr:hypothetical protein OHA77_13345 [Streptosporangium sp. NBC_01639]
MIDDGRLDSAREFVTGFLREEIDETTNPELFGEDVLMFAVIKIDARAPSWILQQLADRRWPLSRRAELLCPMMTNYAEGYAILRDEDPNLMRHMPDPGR